MLVTLVTLPNDASLELLLCDDISSEGVNAPVNKQSINYTKFDAQGPYSYILKTGGGSV